MKKIHLALSTIAICGLFALSNAAENLVAFQIAPLWPKVLLESEKPTAWQASMQIGNSIDRVVGLGLDVSFLWNHYVEEEPLIGNTFIVERDESTYSIPLSFFVSITPLPDFLIYPEISGQIGFNTMFHSKKLTNNNNSDSFDEDGVYMGVIGKVGAAAHFNISTKTSFFAGCDYTWSNPKKIGDDNDDNDFIYSSLVENLVTRRNMSGFGIKFGLRLLMQKR